MLHQDRSKKDGLSSLRSSQETLQDSLTQLVAIDAKVVFPKSRSQQLEQDPPAYMRHVLRSVEVLVAGQSAEEAFLFLDTRTGIAGQTLWTLDNNMSLHVATCCNCLANMLLHVATA